MLFPKWLFFHLNFDAKFLKSKSAFLRYCNFIEDVITDWWKVDFEKNLGIFRKYWYFGNQRSIFTTWKHYYCTIYSSNLKIKYWRFWSMWNLKIDFGTIIWDILTLHPYNSKSSLPTTGTFRCWDTDISMSLLNLFTFCIPCIWSRSSRKHYAVIKWRNK